MNLTDVRKIKYLHPCFTRLIKKTEEENEINNTYYSGYYQQYRYKQNKQTQIYHYITNLYCRQQFA